MPECQLCGSSHPVECPQLRTGERVASFSLGRPLGIGGIAAVYVAAQPAGGPDVAIKVMHKRFAKDKELAGRFIREVRETLGVNHPALVRMYEVGATDDGCPFLVMEKLEGRELYSLRKEVGPMAPEQVVPIVVQILDALIALHARGVIHRDIKSQNIYLVPSPTGDQAKLLDLGFAKVEDQLALTSKEQVLGTPLYISPEQYLDPHAVDARADIFSLGVVMFETLTGEWPYTWESKRELLGKVMKGDLERHPMNKRPDVPSWLDAIVARALAHKREDRFESSSAMKAALEAGPPPTKSGILRRIFGV